MVVKPVPFKDANDLKRRTSSMRITIISLATNIEHQIEIILANYFSANSDDHSLFSSLFYPMDMGLTFAIKIKILEKFLKKVDPDFLNKNSDYINSLNRVRKMRNMFAHSMNPTLEDQKKQVGKMYFELDYVEDGIFKTRQFTLDQMIERVNDIEKISKSMAMLHRKLKK